MPIELFGFTIGKKEENKDVKITTFAQADDDNDVLSVSGGGVHGVYLDTEGAIKGDN